MYISMYKMVYLLGFKLNVLSIKINVLSVSVYTLKKG